MNPIGEEIKNKIKALLQKHYTEQLGQQLVEEESKMKVIAERIDAYAKLSTKKKALPETKARFKYELKNLISESWTNPLIVDFSSSYQSSADAFEEVFADIQESLSVEQSRDRFYKKKDDKELVKVLKVFKRFLFKLRNPSLLFGSKNKTVKYPTHKVLLKNLAREEFQAKMLIDLKEVTNLFFKQLCQQYLQVKELEEKLANDSIDNNDTNIESLMAGFSHSNAQFLTTVDLLLTEKLDQRLEDFEEEYEKSGTIELSNRNFSDTSVAHDLKNAEKKWSQHNLEWRNTIFGLFEEWRSDIDIYILKNTTEAELKKFQKAQVKKLAQQIDPEIVEINEFINSRISAISAKTSNLLSELEQSYELAQDVLENNLVPKLSEKISEQNISHHINRLELNIRKHVEELSNEHVIVKNATYDEPLKTDELKSISPYELIAFETLQKFQNQIDNIKKELFLSLENTSLLASDLGQVVLFSLSSAIAAIKDEYKTDDEARNMAIEGLQRATGRLTTARETLEASMINNSELLEAAVNTFCEKIMELTVNENVGELRLRITKAKTARQAEEVKREVAERLRVRKRWVFTSIRRSYAQLGDYINNLSQKFVLTASKPTMSREVSDFLLESQVVIDSLPLIYRRLYRIEPLEDLELFEGRGTELTALKAAFTNWEHGRFAATALLGEKWGGLTSFINYSLKSIEYPYPVTRFSPQQNAYTEPDLVRLLQDIFTGQTFENINQVISYLNNGPKRVIILEDLQNLYLRKVDGFGALQALCHLITKTSKKIFWITSTTLYTWQYLCKTIRIHEFFSYSIEMGGLSAEQIVNIIWKRNRISGFNITFIASPEKLEDKKFIKLSPELQQQQLKKEYFDSLNAFAKSNISLALIFWLLSTKKVDKSSIEIGSFNNPDLNFLSVLSMDKIYALHALILHDGLTEEQLSIVLNTTETSARLMLLSLFEDGILFLEPNSPVFMVNPIVYRSTISILKSKNLIH